MTKRKSNNKGFTRAASFMSHSIRSVSEQRGFAQSRILTHWEELVGADIAAMARPVKVSYSKGGFGGTLVILTTGAQAPLVEMQKETIRARVNSSYGYNAISRVSITQTAATGFAEGQATFLHKAVQDKENPSTEVVSQAKSATEHVQDAGLQRALMALAVNVLNTKKTAR
jgi:hypothetical protein